MLAEDKAEPAEMHRDHLTEVLITELWPCPFFPPWGTCWYLTTLG